VSKGDFIALINPAMALIFAAAFAILWHAQRQRRYIILLSGGYLAFAFAFLLQYFSPIGDAASRLMSNGLFLIAAICIAVGALERYSRVPPMRPVVFAAGTGFAAFCWFFFVQPDITWRIYVMNFTLGTIALLFAAELRRVPGKKPIDWLLLAVMLFAGLTFFPRPLLAVWFEGPYATFADFAGSLYWISLVFTGSLFLLLFAMTIITAIALDVMDELRHKSETDLLSGLLNRRGFEAGLDAAFVARAPGTPAALIICDIDRFKSINDRYGHAVGDRVIRHFADCLTGATEGQHAVGRIGGEEFALLLENADAVTARLLAEGIRIAFSTTTALGLPHGMQVTASFGIAEVTPGETIDDLFRRADQALYLAKNSGRDCVRIAPCPARRAAG
jgi:diguanylate cyclase (GGDEF)-like protein